MTYVEHVEDELNLDNILSGWFRFHYECIELNDKDLQQQSYQIIVDLIKMKENLQ